MELKASSIVPYWEDRIAKAKASIIIFAPYWDKLTIGLIEQCKLVKAKSGKKKPSITIVTTDNPTNYCISSGALEALEQAVNCEHYSVKAVHNLHAKSMIVDDEIVSCGSQNFTNNSHKRMKELSVLFDEGETENIIGWSEAYDELIQWMNDAYEITDDDLKDIKEKAAGYQEVEKRVKKKRDEGNKKRAAEAAKKAKFYDIKVMKEGLELTHSNISFPEILEKNGIQGKRADWMTLLDAKNDHKLYFVRMNNKSITYATDSIIGEVDSPISNLTYDLLLKPNDSNKASNLLIKASIDINSRSYSAEMQLSYYGGQPYFATWRTNKVKWNSGRSTELTRSDMEELMKRKRNGETLLDRIFETFKPEPVITPESKKISEFVSGDSSKIQLLKYGSHPIWYLS